MLRLSVSRNGIPDRSGRLEFRAQMFWSFAEGGTTAELECGLCIRRGNVTCHALPFPLSLDLDTYRVLGSGP